MQTVADAGDSDMLAAIKRWVAPLESMCPGHSPPVSALALSRFVHVGHLHVGEDEVDRALAHGDERLGAVLAANHLVPLLPEGELEQTQDRGVVVGDEHARHELRLAR